MSKYSDVIIIGGGIIGNATAYYLAKKGVSVTVLDASKDIGIGGSSRNGGVRQSCRARHSCLEAIPLGASPNLPFHSLKFMGIRP